MAAKIYKDKLVIPPIFSLIKERGGISERDMFNTFNMGVGMSIVVAKKDAETALSVLCESGEKAYIMGEIVKGEKGVIFA